MMRSLFSGVSGLRNHQVKMDVIGNNIANINTIGFKSSRVTFEESLTQTLKEASRGRDNVGGKNSFQVGLGMTVASIDSDFSQGNLETTGKVTDMAIQGDAFFVLSDGEKEYFSRAGNFTVDGEGRLVAPKNGFIVQGRLADSDGEISTSQPVTNLALPFGQKAPAKSTTEIGYYCNLDADSDAKFQTYAADYGMAASVTGTGAPLNMTVNGTNDTLTIDIDNDMGSTISRTLYLTQKTYSSTGNLVAEINRLISGVSDLAGEVQASVDEATGFIEISTVDTGGTSTSLQLSGNACPNLQLGTTAKTGTTATTDLNDLDFVTNPLTTGDIIKIAGLNPSGSVVTYTYNYTLGDTVQTLINEINSAFSGSTAALSTDGTLELTDSISGESMTSVSLTFLDDSSGSAAILPAFTEAVEGRAAGTHTASISVYDSKGDTHTVALNFTNIATDELPNVWAWEAVVDDGDLTPLSGNKGTVRFNNDGSLAAFLSDDGQELTFEPGVGADTMRIALDAGETGTFNGITQLRSPTTTVARSQDGYGMGNLQTISIKETGEITGNFTNGISQTLGQIILARFNNPSGLERAGDNMYVSSPNSGTAVKGTVGGGIQSTISSGALEMSNVDLAKEFTDMIVTQRGYQANARVITTSDALLNEVVQLKR